MECQINNLNLVNLSEKNILELKELYLTLNSDLSNNFLDDLDEIKDNIYILMLENKIIGCGTILFEKKIIHKGKKVAHIEDVVIHSDFQGNGLGKKLINYFIHLSKEKDCYKIILDCKLDLLNFYQKLGFDHKNIQMSLYFDV
jgi:glucosamine-phosphate N-acetyltransferase